MVIGQFQCQKKREIHDSRPDLTEWQYNCFNCKWRSGHPDISRHSVRHRFVMQSQSQCEHIWARKRKHINPKRNELNEQILKTENFLIFPQSIAIRRRQRNVLLVFFLFFFLSRVNYIIVVVRHFFLTMFGWSLRRFLLLMFCFIMMLHGANRNGSEIESHHITP